MLKRSAGSKRRPQIRHENAQLGTGAGVTEGPIVVPGHNAFPSAAAQPASAAPAAPSPAASPAASPAPHAYTPAWQAHTSHARHEPLSASSAPSPSPQAYAPTHVHLAAERSAAASPAWAAEGGPYAASAAGAYGAPAMSPTSSLAPPSSAPMSAGRTPSPLPASALVTDRPMPPTPRGSSEVPRRSVDMPRGSVDVAGGADGLRASSDAPRKSVDGPLPPSPAAQRDARSRRPSPPRFAAATPLVGSLSKDQQPAALDAVLSALFDASRKRQTARILRGDAGARPPRALPQPMVPQPGRDVGAYVAPTDEPKFRALHAALRKLKAEWSFLMDDQFNPLALSLALLPSGALRAHLGDFAALRAVIESTLQGTLDDHYESFALAITVNHGMIHALGDAQTHVSAARHKLQHARDALGAKRADLVQMWQRVETVKEAMRVLQQVEQLRGVPDQLETLMSEKQFFQATQLLMRSLRMIQREELLEVGATADLRAYLRAQEHALLEILIEELHNHLYLKSYYCDARWRSYVPGQDALPDVLFGADYASDVQGDAQQPTQLARFLHHVRDRAVYDVRDDIRDEEDGDMRAGAAGAAGALDARSAHNPENDSFLYFEQLLESLARLGKMHYALEMVGQRLPFEVHQLVDTTIDEVDRRHDPTRHTATGAARSEAVFFAPSALTASFLEEGSHKSFSLQTAAQLARPTNQHELSALQRDMETMRDFFWTLFSKLDAVLQGHRVVQEVASAILERADVHHTAAADRAAAEPGVAALGRVWSAVEYEVRALLHDYLSENTHAVANAASHVPSLNALVRAPRYERDKTHALFRMSDVRKQQPALRRSEETVDAALRTFVPGLAVEAGAAPGAGATYLQDPASGGLARPEEYTGAGHRLLVRPLTFTVSVLFQPTLAFIARVAAVLPSDAAGPSRGFGGFLREFVHTMFLPMLEDKVQQLAATATAAPEAFAAEPATRTPAARPVVRSAAQIVALVDSLYTMLQVAPFHRASYSRLILMVFVEYYERCNERFKQLVAEDMDAPSGPYVRAATWAQRRELYACLCEARHTDPHSLRGMELRFAESQLERRYAAESPVRRADLITSRKRLLALGHLQYSVQWLLQHMAQLRATEHDAALHTPPSEAHAVRHGAGATGAAPLALPLSPELVHRFEEVPQMYRRLSDVLLMTLRVELRLKVLHALPLALTEGTYLVDAGALEPDSHVVDLNTDLATGAELLKETVLVEHLHFPLDGLDVLMDAVMIQGVHSVRAINRHGVTKMIRNILSLQQNVKNLVAAPHRVDLERSKKFWEMLAREPEQWLATLQHTQAPHTLEDYRAALALCLGVERGLACPPAERAAEGARAGATPDFVRIPHAGTTRQPVTHERYTALLRELDASMGATV